MAEKDGEERGFFCFFVVAFLCFCFHSKIYVCVSERLLVRIVTVCNRPCPDT